MGRKATKASRKYAASGQLKKEIQSRKKHQQLKKKFGAKKAAKTSGGREGTRNDNKPSKEKEDVDEVEENSDDDHLDEETEKFKGMSVYDFLGAKFIGGEDEASEEDDREDEEEAEEGEDDDASFASVDGLEDEAGAHKMELAKLKEKDPEFYKYLQENDKELLEFDVSGNVDDDEDDGMEEDGSDDDVEQVKAPTLTSAILKKWQTGLLKQHSLKALRRLLIAFRAAVYMNDEDEVTAWTIDSPAVYQKVVVTALRYTPVILQHHIPYKTSPNGRIKPPTQTKKFKVMQKMINSYFHNILHFLGQASEHDTVLLAVNECAKIVPYIANSRKTAKTYLKTLQNLWSSADDDIRIAAFLAMRRLLQATDESVRDTVFKGVYMTLVRSSKTVNAYTMPSINLMKNTAAELYCSDHAVAYQHAFGYIRQLAVHLRNSMKVKTKEAYKQVYNWQYVHCVDFWSLVLAKACDPVSEAQRGQESELRPLIYPLTQVSLGAIKLVTNSRSYPFHLHIIRSLIHLGRHTKTYIPLVPFIMPVITGSLSPSYRPKTSTQKPLDLETNIRAPQQYLRTRIYLNALLEESTYLLTEWLADPLLQGSVAFPEVVVPITVTLKRSMKQASSGKEVATVKPVLERIEEGAQWIEQRRKTVNFGPKFTDEVLSWERSVRIDDTPMGKFVKTQRKIREKRRKLLEKARDEKEEILED